LTRKHLQRTRLPTEKRSDWSFQPVEGGWIWHVTHPDGTSASSRRQFLTRKECVADATRCGYVAWIPEAERRTTTA
jgi:hypothetical protein